MSDNNPIYKIGLFNKLSAEKAECIQCKNNNERKYEFAISRGSIKSLTTHLGSKHKNSEHFEHYQKLASSGQNKEKEENPKIDTFVVRSSGLFCE